MAKYRVMEAWLRVTVILGTSEVSIVSAASALSRLRSGFFFFSSRRRHTRLQGDWSSDVCSSDLGEHRAVIRAVAARLDEDRALEANLPLHALVRRERRTRNVVGALRRKRKALERSEERRVGKECRSRWSPYH